MKTNVNKLEDAVKADYLATSSNNYAIRTIDFSKINKNKIQEYIEFNERSSNELCKSRKFY